MKPIKVKPSIYAFYFETLKVIAVKYGYCLALHGSMERDLDLIAIPWAEWCKQEFVLKMLQEMDMELNGSHGTDEEYYLKSSKPHGRVCYAVNIHRSGPWNNYKDQEYYIDLSVLPAATTTPTTTPTTCACADNEIGWLWEPDNILTRAQLLQRPVEYQAKFHYYAFCTECGGAIQKEQV